MASLYYSLPSSSAITKAHQIQENKSIFFSFFFHFHARKKITHLPVRLSLFHPNTQYTHTHTRLAQQQQQQQQQKMKFKEEEEIPDLFIYAMRIVPE